MSESTDPADSNKQPARKRKGLFFLILLVIGLIFLSRQEAVKTVDCNPQIIATKPDVIMLGAWWCSYC